MIKKISQLVALIGCALILTGCGKTTTGDQDILKGGIERFDRETFITRNVTTLEVTEVNGDEITGEILIAQRPQIINSNQQGSRSARQQVEYEYTGEMKTITLTDQITYAKFSIHPGMVQQVTMNEADGQKGERDPRREESSGRMEGVKMPDMETFSKEDIVVGSRIMVEYEDDNETIKTISMRSN